MPERNFDFDTVVDRKNTDCLKYDFAERRGYPKDVLPLWVADMDFKTSSYVEDAVVERAHHAIFGYTDSGESYFNAVCGWMVRHHGWEPKQEWLVKTPGVVTALALAVRAYTEKGDCVLLQQPVYYPFSEVIENNGRIVISSTLHIGEDGRYQIDFDDFEQKIVDNNIKLFLLCSPHNPVGRVWSRDELERLGDICVKHGVIVVSDEIHSDFVFKGEHTVFANIKPEFEKISVICTAPSKTFNLAGMLISNIFIPNRELRNKFKSEYAACGLSQLSPIGLVACEAAYTNGDEWYEAVCKYIASNIEFSKKYVDENLPGVSMIEPEGTYLIWLDFRGMGFTTDELEDLIINKAGLWLDSGKIFGEAGCGFQRINVACPRSILEECFDRIKDALFVE